MVEVFSLEVHIELGSPRISGFVCAAPFVGRAKHNVPNDLRVIGEPHPSTQPYEGPRWCPSPRSSLLILLGISASGKSLPASLSRGAVCVKLRGESVRLRSTADGRNEVPSTRSAH